MGGCTWGPQRSHMARGIYAREYGIDQIVMEPKENAGGNAHKKLQRWLNISKLEEDVVFWAQIPMQIGDERGLFWHPFLLISETIERIASKNPEYLDELAYLSDLEVQLQRIREIEVLATFGRAQVINVIDFEAA